MFIWTYKFAWRHNNVLRFLLETVQSELLQEIKRSTVIITIYKYLGLGWLLACAQKLLSECSCNVKLFPVEVKNICKQAMYPFKKVISPWLIDWLNMKVVNKGYIPNFNKQIYFNHVKKELQYAQYCTNRSLKLQKLTLPDWSFRSLAISH